MIVQAIFRYFRWIRAATDRQFIWFVIALTSCCENARASDFMAGGDISSLSVLEDGGAIYRDNGQPGDAIDIFRANGMNWFRLRLFVNPQFENNDNGGYDPFVAQNVPYAIELAQRIKQAGGKLLLDFHYSDTWADPGHQIKPEAWLSLNFSQLQQSVYDHTRQSIEAFKAAGVLPEMVQIGNEISSGMLWQDGRLWRPGVPESTEFNNLAALISAGINGARDGAGPGQEPLIMIHHDQGSQWLTTDYYFDRLLPRLQVNGTDPDVLGFSYYPKWHPGGMAGVAENLNNSAAQHGKPVVIVETGFPSRCPSCETTAYEFPVSTTGQQQFLDALVDVVQNVPNDMGLGVFWWYPEARPVSGLPVWEGGRYGLFDSNGNLLPAANVFEQFLDATLPGDYNTDGLVDSADYIIWRKTLGSTTDLRANGDNTGSSTGVIDQADYNFWKAHFGNSLPAGAGSGQSTVPEPLAILLWAIGIAILTSARRAS
jgi:arabinogalactan endo-1,4-beta-galactosidase